MVFSFICDVPAYVQACNCCKISLILSAIVKRKAYRQALVCGIETEEKKRHRRRYHHHHHYIAYNLKSIRHSFFFFVIESNVKVAKKQKNAHLIYTNERTYVKKGTVFVLEKDFINFVAFFSCVLLFYWKVWKNKFVDYIPSKNTVQFRHWKTETGLTHPSCFRAFACVARISLIRIRSKYFVERARHTTLPFVRQFDAFICQSEILHSRRQ